MIEAARRLWNTAQTEYLGLVGLGLARSGIGFAGFFILYSSWAERQFLFGGSSPITHDDFLVMLDESGTFSLLALSTSPLLLDAVLVGSMVAAACVFLGIGGRWMLAAFFVGIWSIYQRNYLLLDGGDNLLYIVVPLLLLTRSYERIRVRPPRKPPTNSGTLKAIHNVALLVLVFQVSLVYAVSGLYKVQGERWIEGTALYYILRVPEFYLPNVSEVVFTNTWLVPLLTYSATMLLVYFPVLVLVRPLRHVAAVMMMGFHLSIAALMGLTGFALIMISCDFLFLNDPMTKLIARVKRFFRPSQAVDRADQPSPTPVNTSA